MSHESNSFRDQLPEADPSSLLRRSIVQRQCTICEKFRCPLKSHQAFVRHLRARGKCAPVHQLAEEKVDPFAKHPIVIMPEYERLYAQGWQRWNSNFKGPERHLFPHSRYSAVFRNAWHDVVLHYGMLSLLATQVSVLRSGVVDETALELQGKAISAQSRAIHHDQLSDARVMTALCMMPNTFATNKKEDLTVHMALIGASLRQQGGPQYLRIDGIIADNLMLGDYTRAVLPTKSHIIKYTRLQCH